jgi:hypothetical protein
MWSLVYARLEDAWLHHAEMIARCNALHARAWPLLEDAWERIVRSRERRGLFNWPPAS